MALARRRPWLLGPLVAVALLVYGPASMAPHDHRPETVFSDAIDSVRPGSVNQPEALSVTQRIPATGCFACVITVLSFAQANKPPPLQQFAAGAVVSSPAADLVAMPRLWRRPLRGPPLLA